MKLSVVMATYNGSLYIKEQLESILYQLGEEDEVIISDDCSTDDTLEIIESYHDSRIKIWKGKKFGSPVFNFENALKQAQGDIIFLSDQDDVWLPKKVEIMAFYLSEYDVVVSNCYIVDKDLKVIRDSFFQVNTNRRGFWKNLYDNHYLGCCMAFRKGVLDVILPFPRKIAMHDIWIGLCSEVFFQPILIDDKLLLYRRHGGNASDTSEKSSASLWGKISSRVYFLIEIGKRLWRCYWEKK